MSKKFYTIALLVSLMASSISADAQLGNLRGKLRGNKDKSEDNSSKSDSKSDDDENSGSSKKSKRGGGDKEETTEASAEADFKEKGFPPTVSLYSILDGGLHMDLRDPYPFIAIPEIAFLPTKDVNGKPLFKSSSMPKNDPIVIYGQIKDKSGKVIYKQAEVPIGSGTKAITPITKNDWHDIEIADRNSPWPAGSYTFEITITGKVIFSMPFDIIVGKNDDPYANLKEIRMIDGYWSKYACYHFDKRTDVFEFITYETNHNMKLKGEANEGAHYMRKTQVFYNGKPFTTENKDEGTVNRGAWEKKHNTFHAITDKFERDYLKSGDFKDGSYFVRETFNDKVREYPFKIKDGKPVYIDEQDKTKTTDPAKCLEGTNEYVFMKNSK